VLTGDPTISSACWRSTHREVIIETL